MKTKRTHLQWAFALLFIAAIFTACDDDDNNIRGTFDKGVLISNEGSFGTGNGSISYYSYEGDSIANNIFQEVNGRQLGDVVQDIETHDDKVYIVVNASNKVEIANRFTLTQKATLEGLKGPRYAEVAGNGQLYVSQWGKNGQIRVFHKETYENADTLNVGNGPEELLAYQNYVYVANGGGYGYDNTLTVINTNQNEVVDTIEVGDCPKSLVMDANDKLWVLCHGYITYNNDFSINIQTPSQLVQINPENNQVLQTIDISQTMHPGKLAISRDGNTLYYGGGYGVQGIYAMNINETSAPGEPFINVAAYGFGTEPDKDVLYVGVAPSFSESGKLIRYDYAGNKLGEYTAGVGPNGIGKTPERPF